MRKALFAIAAGLLLLPAACLHHGHHGWRSHHGGPDCPKRWSCDCACRQQPDCPKKADCPTRPDCPQKSQQEAPPPAK